ncbi:uncharacterized protein [Watersipora subatra]|uniref:uncharacterized protein n=1 Tax=Watersipora subatra TaxID=2589382 RepID=UPI00355B2289
MDSSSMNSNNVEVWIYDLSKGLARSMSMPLLGKQIDGIWHTGIVAYGKEYFFGGDSIECCSPGGTVLGQPDSKVNLGTTEIPYDIFHEHLRELSQTSFRACDYHLLHRNCNNFSSEVAQFLTGKDIPSHITGLPDEVMNTPFGQMILPMLNSMSVNPGGGSQKVFGESQPSHRVVVPAVSQSAPSQYPSGTASRDQPKKVDCITFNPKQVPVVADICDEVSRTSQEVSLLVELMEYLDTESPSWSVSPAHVKLLGSLLSSSNGFPERQSHILRMFQKLLTKTDAVAIIKRCDSTTLLEQLSLDNMASVQTLCNLCSTAEGYRHCLLTRRNILEKLPQSLNTCNQAEEIDSFLSAMLNVAVHHKLADDLDIQFTCAIVEYLNTNSEADWKTVELALKTLWNFMSNNAEVKMLAFAMGLNLDKYTSSSGNREQPESLNNVVNQLLQLQAA